MTEATALERSLTPTERSPESSELLTRAAMPRRLRGRLFLKYVGLFVSVVSIALLANGLFEVWFSYQEHKAALVRVQREQAEAVASKVRQFFPESQGQL